MVAVLLLITLTARKHSLVMNSLIHPLLAFPVHPLLGQEQRYFAWKLLLSASHLKGDPARFALHIGHKKLLQAEDLIPNTHVLQETALSSSGVISMSRAFSFHTFIRGKVRGRP